VTNPSLLYLGGSVLAAIDPSVYAASVADYAAWAAQRIGSPLAFVHAIERSPTPQAVDLSGSLSLGSRDELLEELARVDEQRGRLGQVRGRQLLDQAVQRVHEQHALTARAHLRHGELIDTLLDLEPDVRLLVIGKRGEHADFARGHLGSSLERVVRAVHRPVFVASRAFRPLKRFMIAFDGSATARKCVGVVCESPLLKGLDCDVVMAGQASDASRAHLEWARQALVVAGFQPNMRVVPGSADQVIVDFAQREAIDLIVMGAYGHSKIRHLIVGSTTTHVLRSCQIPMLLLR
jgi:nucleotide-binding universal stress UspA family protein